MPENEITPAVEEFLATQRNLILATIRRDGRPQLSPVWYVWRDGAFFISTVTSTAKWRNLVRDPRCSGIMASGEAFQIDRYRWSATWSGSGLTAPSNLL